MGCCCGKKEPPGPTPEELAAIEEKKKAKELRRQKREEDAAKARAEQQQRVAAQLAAILGAKGAIQASQAQIPSPANATGPADPQKSQRSNSVMLAVENMQRRLDGQPELTHLPNDYVHPFAPAAARKSSVILAAENAGKD